LPDIIGQALGGTITNEIGGGREAKIKALLNGTQEQQDQALQMLDEPRQRAVAKLDRQIEDAKQDGNLGKVQRLTAERDTLADKKLSNRALVSQAAVIKFGRADAGNHTVVATIGANSGVIPLNSTPATLPAEGEEIVVTARRITESLDGESTIGRVVVDGVNYAKDKVESYGGYGRYALVAVRTVATGGMGPLLSEGVNQGISRAIPLLPDQILRPLAQLGASLEDFVGGTGGGYLLDTDRENVSQRDKAGVYWGAEQIVGIKIAAIAGAVGLHLGKRKPNAHNLHFPDYNQARNAALGWLDQRGFKAEQKTLGKFGDSKGVPIGMQTADRKSGFRVEFDSRHGAHINVWSGKQKETFTFEGDRSQVDQIVKRFMKVR